MTNKIHPTAIVGPDVTLGDGNEIGPFCLLVGRTRIGDNNRFEAYVSVGSPPEHRRYWREEYGGVRIGSGCIVREFVTINSGTTRDTQLGDRVTMLRGSHIGHDADIHDDVNLSCNVLVGGETTIMRGANLGLGAIIHQQCLAGPYAMLGMGAIATKATEIRPFETYTGNPARFLKRNEVGLKNSGLSEQQLGQLEANYVALRERLGTAGSQARQHPKPT